LLEASLTADTARLERIATAIAKISDPKWSERLISAYANSQYIKVKTSIFRAMAEIYNRYNIPTVETFIIKISHDKAENNLSRRNAMVTISNHKIIFGRGGTGLTIQPDLEAYLASFVQDLNESDEMKVESCSLLIRYFPSKYEAVAIALYGEPKANNTRFRLARSIFYEFDPKWVKENLKQLIPLLKVNLPNGTPDNTGRADIWATIYITTKQKLSLELNPNESIQYDSAKQFMTAAVIRANSRDKTSMTEAEVKKLVEDLIVPWKKLSDK
jgi:hypothetical protein